mgnify:CR=1 FL=1
MHFAKVVDGIVEQVICIDQEMLETGFWGDPSMWIQTSYNTRGGVYYKSDSNDVSDDQEKALRKNYAGIGYTYDRKLDAFIPPKLFKSWVLNEETCLWEPPVTRPDDGQEYYWDEDSAGWVKYPTEKPLQENEVSQ